MFNFTCISMSSSTCFVAYARGPSCYVLSTAPDHGCCMHLRSRPLWHSCKLRPEQVDTCTWRFSRAHALAGVQLMLQPRHLRQIQTKAVQLIGLMHSNLTHVSSGSAAAFRAGRCQCQTPCCHATPYEGGLASVALAHLLTTEHSLDVASARCNAQ